MRPPRMSRRAKPLYLAAMESFVAALDGYNRLSGRFGTSVPLVLLDHAVEMLMKAALVHFGHTIVHKRTKLAYSLSDCFGALRDTIGKWAGRDFPKQPLVLFLHDQRNRAQHLGIAVSEPMLAELMARGCEFYAELHEQAFGKELATQIPERYSVICPATKANVVDLCQGEIDFARLALQAADRPSAENAIRNVFLLQVATNDDRSLDERSDFVLNAEISSAVDGRRLRRSAASAAMTRKLPVRKKDLVVLLDDLAGAEVARPIGESMRLTQDDRGIPVRVDASDPGAIPVDFLLSKSALAKVEHKWASQISNFNGQRSVGKPYTIDAHILLEFYLHRAHSCFARLSQTETLALVLSSMTHRLPFWAWLGRLDETHIFRLIRTVMEENSSAQVVRACARVLRYGKGAHLRRRLADLAADDRTTVAQEAQDALAIFDAPAQQRRDAILTQIPTVPAEDAWTQITHRFPKFEHVAVRIWDEKLSLQDVLSLEPAQIDQLPAELERLPRDVRRDLVRFLSFVEDERLLGVHVAAAGAPESDTRLSARRALAWFDENTYCPFLKGRLSGPPGDTIPSPTQGTPY